LRHFAIALRLASRRPAHTGHSVDTTAFVKTTTAGFVEATRGCTLLRRFCRALSRRHYDQLGALKPGLGLARPLWRSKELRACQSLHDLPPMVGWWLADNDQFYL